VEQNRDKVPLMMRRFNELAYHQLVRGGTVDELSLARAVEADLVSVPPPPPSSGPSSATSIPLEGGWVSIDHRPSS